MRSVGLWLLSFLILSMANTARGDATTTFQDVPKPITVTAWQNLHINEQLPVILKPEYALELINSTIVKNFKQEKEGDVSAEGKDFYCVIHVLRWSEPASGKQTVQGQNWYVFHYYKKNWSLENFSSLKRIYGVKTVWFLYLHLNKQTEYEARYEISIKNKLPAYLSHLFALAQQFLPSAPAQEAETVQYTKNYWGAVSIPLGHVPCDMTFTPDIARIESNVVSATAEKIGDPQTFNNEGKYYVDFSVAVPIRKISQLKFDSTANTVTAATIDKQNVFALFNFYYPPVDISSSYSWIPHLSVA